MRQTTIPHAAPCAARPARPADRPWLPHRGLAALALGGALLLPGAARAQAEEEMNSRIVGGVPAAEGAWPSLVSVQIARGGGRTGYCGGTVIARTWVLTAAHCVQGASAGSVTVVEGTHDLRRGGRRIAVSRLVQHPNYRHGGNFPSDVAVLQLAEPARVEPQALVSRAIASRVIQPREFATVAGFGGVQPEVTPGTPHQIRPTGPQALSPRLLQVNVPVVSQEACRRSYGSRIYAGQICAGFEEGGRDSCGGDSGGPLYMLGPVGRPVQVGIVSWGEGCAQPGRYGVYASVATYQDFIQQHVRDAVFVGGTTTTTTGGGGTPVTGGGGTPTATPGTPPRPPRPNPTQPVLAAGTPAPATPPGLVGQVGLDILPGPRVPVGETITLRIQTAVAGTLMVFNIDATGTTTQLFPNRRSAPTPGAFTAATRVRPGSTLALPGPADGFVLRARPPVGENRILAVVAPPGAQLDGLLSRNMDLGAIPDPDGFFQQLADILQEAQSRVAPLTTAPEAEVARQLAIQPVRPPVPMAERSFTIVER